MSWATARLADLCSDVFSGGTPSSGNAAYYGGDIPWLRTQEVVFNRIFDTDIKITEAGYENSSVKWVPAKSVIVAMYGNSAGRSAITEVPLTTNQACCNLAIDPSKADYRFVFYALSLRYEELKSLSKGAAQNNLNAAQVKGFKISVPRLVRDQNLIADVISAYDDLIENNRRRIKLLEDAARLLYREWFVHLRFPGHEHVKVVDGVPEGWVEASLGQMVRIRKGRNITRDQVEEGPVPVVAAGLGPSCFHNTANAVGPVITVSASGANAGFVNIYPQDIWASDCSYISAETTQFIYFYYCLLKEEQRRLTAMQQGAAQPHVYPKDIQEMSVFSPREELIEEFQKTVSPSFELMDILRKQSDSLAQARDLLLPRLMSGELTV